MSQTEFYSQAVNGPYEVVDVGPFTTSSGVLLDSCPLAFSTYGDLNEAKDNAILVPTWYSGTSKSVAEVFVGEGRALDPAKYFIVVVNQIGGGLSFSPNNCGGQAFPAMTIADDVVAQERLVCDHFGIERLLMVFGGSMGGQQGFQWAAQFPEKLQKLVVVAASPSASDYLRAVLAAMEDTLCESIEATESLKRHGRLWAAYGLSNQFWLQKGYQALGFDDWQGFISGFMEPYFAPMDRSVLKAMIAKAAAANAIPNDDEKAHKRICKNTLVIPIDTDLVFPPTDIVMGCAEFADCTFATASSTHGHLALFGADREFLAFVDQEVNVHLAKGVEHD